MKKFGAPASAHVRHITAEDAELINSVVKAKEEKVEEKTKNVEKEEDKSNGS